MARPQSPLWVAMGAPLPWHGTGAATFLHIPNGDETAPGGFVQGVKRFARPEADVTAIAPALSVQSQTEGVWQKLLEHITMQAGEHGIQRLYACLETDDGALDTLIAGGFVPYIQETLYSLGDVPVSLAAGEPAWPHVRPQLESDSFALQRLHNLLTPPVIQQAEGTLINHGETPSPLDLRNWWQPEHVEGLVYVRQDEIIAAAQIRRGRSAHWLQILIDPSDDSAAHELLDCCLYTLAHYRNRPVYCALRSYQGQLALLLQERRFETTTALTRLVRHTTRMAKSPVASRSKELIEITIPGLLTSDIPYSDLNAAPLQTLFE
ncbi:MAG: hypothetical protein J5I90_07930 [Caldilineales bacterium]|nr:hypothetical protein [Caldilineales bacterium]